MKQNVCTYADTRDERIVAYLYDESDGDERRSFSDHLAACALCRAEMDALRGVRAELGHWAPPESSFSVILPSPSQARVVPLPAPASTRWQIPLWAQAVAAVLLVGVGAAVANLHITYSAAQGLSVRTGWQQASADAVPVAAPVPAPWRSDLEVLEERLRSEMAVKAVAATTVAVPSNDEAMRRVRVLLQESEQRQQRDLALRFAQMAREVESQRQTDLIKIDRSLGLIQSRTGMEVMRTQQQVNSLAQRVSQRP